MSIRKILQFFEDGEIDETDQYELGAEWAEYDHNKLGKFEASKYAADTKNLLDNEEGLEEPYTPVCEFYKGYLSRCD